MKYTSKENQTGLAKQATRKWKQDHIVFKVGKNYSYTQYNETAKRKGITGDIISWKELQKEDRKQAKEVDSLDKHKKSKSSSKLSDTTSKNVLSDNREE